MRYTRISADCHIDLPMLPTDLFTSTASTALRDRMPYVAEGPDGPSLHAHVVLGLADGTTRGGHLLEGRVFPTLEVVITEAPAELRKVMRPDIGIALIDLDQSEA